MRTTLALVFVLALSALGFAGALNNPGRYPVIFNPGRAAAINSSIRTPIISWNTPTTRVGGAAANANEIQSYKIYYGTTSGLYTDSITFSNTVNDTALNILYLPAGSYYMSIVAIDTNGVPSGYAPEITVTVGTTQAATYSVTPSVSGQGGTISPSSPQVVSQNSTTTFTVQANTGYIAQTPGGTCGGTFSGSTYTTNAVTADCTVVASFVSATSTVTSSVSGTGGTITPFGSQTVINGVTVEFALSPSGGYSINTVGGTCGGLLSGATYTTSAVVQDCTVIAYFTQNPYPVYWDAVTQNTNNASTNINYYTLKWTGQATGSRNVGNVLTYDLRSLLLSAGSYSFTVTATDSGGLESAASNTLGVTL